MAITSMTATSNSMYISTLFILLYFTSIPYTIGQENPFTTSEGPGIEYNVSEFEENLSTTVVTESVELEPESNTTESLEFSSMTTEKDTTERMEESPELSLVLMKMKTQLKVNQVFENEHKKTGNVHGKIVLLGLFELTTKQGPRPEGLSELSAAQMAVQHINSKQLLPGYTLELLTNDTQCDPGVGVDRFFHALYTQNTTRMVMLLGSACSEVTESLAKVVPHWNIVQVSFGSTSPALSDRQEFPYFYRTVAPDSSHNPARIAFIRKFGWDTVTTFSQNEEVHSLAVNDLVTELESANISCAATITFAETDFKEQLLLLRELDTRIIIGSFSQELAPKIFCEVFKLKMFGADYAWILHESMRTTWWQNVEFPSSSSTFSPPTQTSSSSKSSSASSSTSSSKRRESWKKDTKGKAQSTRCSPMELYEAVENLIIVSSHNSIVGNNISFSGLNNEMFMDELRTKFKVHTSYLSMYAPQTYDAVWAIALALRGAQQHFKTSTNVTSNNKGGSKSSSDKSSNSNYLKLDRFDYTRQDMAYEFLKQLGTLNFLGVSGPVSFSGPDRIGTTAFYQIQKGVMETVALFNPTEQNLDFNCPNCKDIKWHSGQVPIAKRIFKLKVVTISPTAFYTVATLSSVGILLAIAFLVFNLHFRKLKAIKLSSPKLSNITAVGCILVYTAVVLLGLDYSTLPSAETSFSTVCTVEVCRSQYTQSWLGALYAYKGLLLIVGVYMAWETRHVKIPALNDSQYIGVSVYSVVITSAIVVLLANLLSEQVTLAFITISALILTSVTATLCLLFAPKLHDILSRNDVIDPVIHSMGLKMEYNTRRFVIDDKRELQYRVEVQNRVYKKEIAALDAEIRRLERLLDSTNTPPTGSSTSSSASIIAAIQKKIILTTA